MTLLDPGDPTGAPPPPGTDTPVPSDAASRAAAAGRARRTAARVAPDPDRLVPTKALESRAEERARLRRERAAMAAAGSAVVADPGADAWAGGPYAAGPYAAGPYAAGPYATIQPVVPLPPRIRWTKRQRAAALLSSWVGQTLMALATHFLTAFFLIVGFAFLLHASGDGVAEFEADSLTTVVSRWSTPDRVWATVLIGLLVGGVILGVGWLVNALWARSAGLDSPHRSTWLAWLCTTAATGLIGVVVWPMALIGGFFLVLASSSASLTVGTMWTLLFSLLGIAIVLTGGVGLLFGWLFLSMSRPRVDNRALAVAEETAARARDEADLAGVQLRDEPSR